MKANEFVKKFGLDRARQFVNADDMAHALVFATTKVSFLDLKRLVDSHDLVESYGGLNSCCEKIYMLHELAEDPEPIKKAIADVESCK